MNRRFGFGLFWLLVTAGIATIVGLLAYHAGQTATIVTTTGEPHAVYYPAYGWGFGFFPFFGLIFFGILVFALFFRRPWGRGPWGWGGPSGWYGGGIGPGSVPPGVEERLMAWHQQAHGERPTTPAPGQSDSPASSS